MHGPTLHAHNERRSQADSPTPHYWSSAWPLSRTESALSCCSHNSSKAFYDIVTSDSTSHPTKVLYQCCLIATSRMMKRKRGSSASLRTDSVSPNRPRLNPQERLLSWFYEPLVLLYTLGRTRGESVRAVMPLRDHIAHLLLVDLRRTFLNDSAYMCDYKKGSETVTAIRLQSTLQKHIF
jgi:hypothetical protein